MPNHFTNITWHLQPQLKSVLQLLLVLQNEFKPVRIEGLISTKTLQSSGRCGGPLSLEICGLLQFRIKMYKDV